MYFNMEWIRQHIEYPMGVLGAVLSGSGIGMLTNAIIGTVASVVGGTLMVIVTHFIKRWLQEHYPIKK